MSLKGSDRQMLVQSVDHWQDDHQEVVGSMPTGNTFFC